MTQSLSRFFLLGLRLLNQHEHGHVKHRGDEADEAVDIFLKPLAPRGSFVLTGSGSLKLY